MDTGLLSLAEATERLRPSRRRYLGVASIDVDSIIGTVDREGDFDRDFTARRPALRERQRRLAQAFPNGDFAPITVEKLGDAHFVVDGHHRVAIARRRGMASIDAEITELTARWHLSSSADAEELIHAEQERLFMSESGLAESRPDARVRFTRAVGYRQLLEAMQVHGYTLMLERGRPLDRAEVADDWYSFVYRPTLELIAASPIVPCANATESDGFVWLWERRRELSVDHVGLQLHDALRFPTDPIRRRRLRRSRQEEPPRSDSATRARRGSR